MLADPGVFKGGRVSQGPLSSATRACVGGGLCRLWARVWIFQVPDFSVFVVVAGRGEIVGGREGWWWTAALLGDPQFGSSGKPTDQAWDQCAIPRISHQSSLAPQVPI